MYSSYLPIVTARMAIPTSFTLEIFGEETSPDEYNIVVRVNKVASYTGTNLKIRFAVTESDIQYNWQGQTEMNFVCRDMVPTDQGTSISFDNGNEVDIPLNFTYNSTWVEDEVELIAFIQNDQNKEVLHCAKVMINDLVPPSPTFMADFYADVTDMCESGATDFFAECIGEPISYHWTFEGGYPAESWDKNPYVYYAAVGSYDVQLVISDGSKTDTAVKEKYIAIHTLPVVTFNQVPELCDEDWDPYELTEGAPAGGVYSGPHITDGKYFHPTEAGVGSYNLTYTYEDEYGCINTDQQTVVVTSCTGIGDKSESVGLQIYPNPTSGLMNITIDAVDFNQAQIKVIDVVGKVVFIQDEINVNGTYSTTIDLSTLPKGLYFVTIAGGDKNVSKKVFLN